MSKLSDYLQGFGSQDVTSYPVVRNLGSYKIDDRYRVFRLEPGEYLIFLTQDLENPIASLSRCESASRSYWYLGHPFTCVRLEPFCQQASSDICADFGRHNDRAAWMQFHKYLGKSAF